MIKLDLGLYGAAVVLFHVISVVHLSLGGLPKRDLHQHRFRAKLADGRVARDPPSARSGSDAAVADGGVAIGAGRRSLGPT